MKREFGHCHFIKAWRFLWVQITQKPPPAPPTPCPSTPPPRPSAHPPAPHTSKNRRGREENSMHYLTVHTKVLGTAQASWNFLASLLELRNPLVPRGEVPRVFIISVKVHCSQGSGGTSQGPRVGNKFLPWTSRQWDFLSQFHLSYGHFPQILHSYPFFPIPLQRTF